ncbi:MarR family winged helix-turn-helix transcriptional regulator [Paenibacillus jiagnxiensis]|uniref:MarR family winged helix-turn-helix transcriptional regulator n=1 Tax=Paenibacillus jiagnxiensis TaxID=3228926 RepID=UPI0033B1EF73
MDTSSFFQKIVAFTTAVHEVKLELTKDVKSEAITPVQYKILEYLVVSQPVTLSEISECTQMSMPNTSRELRKLSEKQLCEKHTDTEDRRKQVIRLSEKGEAMMHKSFERIESRFAERIKEVSEEELKEIERALELLHHKVFY